MIAHLFSQSTFTDRYIQNPENAVDVLIPIIHTNELWKENLISIYREIPVKRLLISDGGCIDDSLDILKHFPRVEIFDHKSYKSLGYCLRKLMEEVKTEHFIYLHSDVFLPRGWFEVMWKSGQQYDWCESKHINTYLLDIEATYAPNERALSGAQIGKKRSFDKILPLIEDDFLYRNEDIIFSELIKRTGGTYGRSDSLIYHEIMNKRSQWKRAVTKVRMEVDKSPEEEVREFDMQARGLVKYLPPNDQTMPSVFLSLQRLIELKVTTIDDFKKWMQPTPYAREWNQAIDSRFTRMSRVRIELEKLDSIFRVFVHQVLKVLKTLFS